MITKNDCMSILVKLEDQGLDINPYMLKLVTAKEIPLEVLRFISKNRGIEVANFYEMLRKSHNQKKSPLYTNIVKEQDNEDEIIITLNCLLTQILLYCKKGSIDKDNFYKESRAEEISRCLNDYFETGDIAMSKTLLSLIKSDLLVLEHIAGRRDLI